MKDENLCWQGKKRSNSAASKSIALTVESDGANKTNIRSAFSCASATLIAKRADVLLSRAFVRAIQAP
jgi:hypothetical protein